METSPAAPAARPVDALSERLNDPTVAASLVTLLDHAELLSTLVLGLGGFLERGDSVMDAVAESVNDLKAGTAGGDSPLADLGRLRAMGGQLSELAPTLEAVASSRMVAPETIQLLSDVSDAAVEGVSAAQASPGGTGGIRGLYKALRDPEVQRGLDVLIEISRALGRRLG
jgi:hypothetical protein